MISFQIIDSGNKDEDQGKERERESELQGKEGECSLGTMLTEPHTPTPTLCIIVAKNRQKERGGGGVLLLPLLLLVTSANKMTAAEELGREEGRVDGWMGEKGPSSP